MDGRPWNSAEVAAAGSDIAGPGAKLVRYDGVERFDVLPPLVATDASPPSATTNGVYDPTS